MDAVSRVYLPDVVGRHYGDFWRDKHLYRVLKGGKGSKKSVTTATWLIYHITKHPLANALVVRDIFNTHKDSTFAELKKAARKLKLIHLFKFNVSPLEITYRPTGQKILFRGFDDPFKLMSITVDVGYLCWVWVEEAFEIKNEEDFDNLDLSIRGELPQDLWQQITLTYNPWVYTHWTKKRFWDPPTAPPDVFRKTTTYKHNEFLSKKDVEKIEKLRVTNPQKYKVVGEGEYGIPGGQYFDRFREDFHVIQPFAIPDDWIIYPGMDYGNTTVAEFVTQNPKTGTFYICGEWEVNSTEDNRVEGKERARMYRQYLNRYYPNMHLQTTGDTNMFAKFAEFGKDAPVSADYFRKEGVDIVPVVKRRSEDHTKFRISMNEYVRDLLSWAQDKNGFWLQRPKLYIFNTCTSLIETLPQLRVDEKDEREINPYIDDKKTKKIDHAYDAMKYGITRFIHSVYRKPNDEQRAKAKRVLWATAKAQE